MHYNNFGNFYTREIYAIPIPMGFIPIPIPIMSRMAIPIPMGFTWDWDSHGVSHSHTHLYSNRKFSFIFVGSGPVLVSPVWVSSAFQQIAYLYGCSPVCVRRWRVRLAERGKVLPQYLHEYRSEYRSTCPIAPPPGLQCAVVPRRRAAVGTSSRCRSTSTVLLASTAGLNETMSGRLRRCTGSVWKSGVVLAYSRPALQFNHSIN